MFWGGQFFFYIFDYKEVRGFFILVDNEDYEQFWILLFFGEEIVIEVQLFVECVYELCLKFFYVNYVFENFSVLIFGFCNLDVICDVVDGWGIVDFYCDII